MKLLLKENIESLGKKGDIVDVSPGYGRNYLLPKNMAVKVTASNSKMIEIEQKALQKGLEKEIQSHQEVIGRLNQAELFFVRKADEKNTLFGSVNSADIKSELEQKGFDFDKRRILLEEPIKKVGDFKVPVKVFQEYQGEITVHVRGEEEPEEKAEKKPGEEPEKETKPPAEEKPVSEGENKEEAPEESETGEERPSETKK
ncbi:MAG: 50S ribosomal protein L9 [Candidatus Aminicenantes bacterium]